MKQHNYNDSFFLAGPTVVTVGMFDGVHLGHRRLLAFQNELADRSNSVSAVVTFWPHPRIVLGRNDSLGLLNTYEERLLLLESAGVRHVVLVPFDRRFAALTAREFIETVLKAHLGCATLLLGYNHRFGSDGLNTHQCRLLTEEEGIAVEMFDKQVMDVLPIGVTSAEGVAGALTHKCSSSEIRRALETGGVELARQLLGYSYFLEGTVVRGRGLGRTFGFPTANIEGVGNFKLIPADGVYLIKVKCNLLDSYGVLNIGFNPSVGNDRRTIEAHVLDYEGDLYGETVRVEFLRRLRGERTFSDVGELAQQIKRDVATAKMMIKSNYW